MGIAIKKGLAQLLFWLYDFIDTIFSIFNILTGTQQVEEGANGRSLLEVFVESAVSTKVLIGLCIVSVIIAGVCVGIKVAKNLIRFKAGGEQASHTDAIKQGCIAVLSSVLCIFFVMLFIAFCTMLLNMVNDVITPAEGRTLSQSLFDLSVEDSYVIDETQWAERQSILYDDDGNPVYEEDADGNTLYDENGSPIYKYKTELYHPYATNEDGSFKSVTGWVAGYSQADEIEWSMSPSEVFGKYNKDWIGLWESEEKGYETGWEPMVRLDSFNLFTAYLVAVIMLISMFMLCIGLVKRIYDIIILLICMPLVCGTIPLDDGARFRAWRETMMSKVLIAFGAVVAINVFFMISGFVVSGAFDMKYLVDEGVLNDTAVTVFKMLLLLGGAVCINGSQALVARILGTSADEGREALQGMSMIAGGVRMGAVGALGAGRLAVGGGRLVVGGTNRYGRKRTGLIPLAVRGASSLHGLHSGGKKGGKKGDKGKGGKGSSKGQLKTVARPGGLPPIQKNLAARKLKTTKKTGK